MCAYLSVLGCLWSLGTPRYGYVRIHTRHLILLPAGFRYQHLQPIRGTWHIRDCAGDASVCEKRSDWMNGTADVINKISIKIFLSFCHLFLCFTRYCQTSKSPGAMLWCAAQAAMLDLWRLSTMAKEWKWNFMKARVISRAARWAVGLYVSEFCFVISISFFGVGMCTWFGLFGFWFFSQSKKPDARATPNRTRKQNQLCAELTMDLLPWIAESFAVAGKKRHLPTHSALRMSRWWLYFVVSLASLVQDLPSMALIISCVLRKAPAVATFAVAVVAVVVAAVAVAVVVAAVAVAVVVATVAVAAAAAASSSSSSLLLLLLFLFFYFILENCIAQESKFDPYARPKNIFLEIDTDILVSLGPRSTTGQQWSPTNEGTSALCFSSTVCGISVHKNRDFPL